MRAREVMTTEVVAVGTGTSAKEAAALLAEGGFAALPVVDGEGRVLGIVAEADVLRDRLPRDPRLHVRRDDEDGTPPPALVSGIMTADVSTVQTTADVADIARLFVDARLRSVPVTDRGRLVGIVSRRDLLRTLLRPDDQLRTDLVALVAEYTGEPGDWDVTVSDGFATITRTGGTPEGSAGTEERALRALARTVSGIVDVRVSASGTG